jgi:hypothetical protein
MLLQSSSVVGKAMGEALSSSSGQLRQVGSSGDPLIELPTFFVPAASRLRISQPFCRFSSWLLVALRVES